MSEIDIKLKESIDTFEKLHEVLDHYSALVRKIVLNGSAHAHFQGLQIDPNASLSTIKGIPVFVDEHAPDWIKMVRGWEEGEDSLEIGIKLTVTRNGKTRDEYVKSFCRGNVPKAVIPNLIYAALLKFAENDFDSFKDWE